MKPRGFTVAEVMVAMLLGCLVLIAATRLIAVASGTLRTRDDAADLLARADMALDAMEADVQLAGYYGLADTGRDFGFLQGGDAAAALPGTALRETAPPLAPLPASAQACGNQFAVDLAVPLAADNNRFVLGRGRTAACSARGGARAGADTLTVRHAEAQAASGPDAGRLQLLVSRTDPRQRWLLLDGVLPAVPAPAPLQVQLHDLTVQSYYVANSSTGAPALPALRVKSLTRVGAAASFLDTELMSGVEDLQVRLLTATGAYDPDALPPGETPRALQLWLLLRAARPEPGFADARDYAYADRVLALSPADRQIRRLLVSRIIALRNVPAP